ncbi:hypothetical protein [Tessaracoccus caeni]|uniref:hypothetical protein n=1 Tax=Tessaracoccus caeni TaxID=3031239 RepID=UPI0023D9D4AA|nr:hypothetical protein [Tessaracoccus caeni]MDF1489029.1 hypothetical protein [Tessaracoccus caeni]
MADARESSPGRRFSYPTKVRVPSAPTLISRTDRQQRAPDDNKTTDDGEPADALMQEQAEPTGCYLRLNYSGAKPGAFPEAARIIGRHC